MDISNPSAMQADEATAPRGRTDRVLILSAPVAAGVWSLTAWAGAIANAAGIAGGDASAGGMLGEGLASFFEVLHTIVAVIFVLVGVALAALPVVVSGLIARAAHRARGRSRTALIWTNLVGVGAWGVVNAISEVQTLLDAPRFMDLAAAAQVFGGAACLVPAVIGIFVVARGCRGDRASVAHIRTR